MINKPKIDIRKIFSIVLICLLCVIVVGCGRYKTNGTADIASASESSADVAAVSDIESEYTADATTASDLESEYTAVSDIESEYTADAAATSDTAGIIDEYGIYDSKDDVALYIATYDKLPSNYITKKEAKKLGWSGGSLEPYAPGKCIGGDYFGNYEGNLPEDKEYHECDIDTLGAKSRGAKRIVYSDDGYIYYTDDHYETFELLYEP